MLSRPCLRQQWQSHSYTNMTLQTVVSDMLPCISDGSEWRQRIEQEAEHFLDVSSWSVGDIAGKISSDEIQVAINLNGYTKGARNEIFALLPAPVQTSYMGFPATTGMHPCSYLRGSTMMSGWYSL